MRNPLEKKTIPDHTISFKSVKLAKCGGFTAGNYPK